MPTSRTFVETPAVFVSLARVELYRPLNIMFIMFDDTYKTA